MIEIADGEINSIVGDVEGRLNTRIDQTEEAIDARANLYDDYLNKMMTVSAKLEVDENDEITGLRLRKYTDGEQTTYSTLIRDTGMQILDQNDEVKASFEADGAFISDIRAQNQLSIGSTDYGWYDFVIAANGLGIKWRDAQ